MNTIIDKTLMKTSLNLAKQLIFFKETRVRYPQLVKLDVSVMLEAIA